MKPMPVFCKHCATCAGFSPMNAPSDSSTSALPDVLDTLRPPCLATRAPAAAATNIDAVEMLKLCEPSPPVPTMSTRCVLSGTSTRNANSRITCAAAAISPMVSFFTRRPIAMAAIITADISPLMIRRISASISSWKISRCSITRKSASVLVMVTATSSGSKRLAQDAHGAVDVVGTHVEVRDQAQLVQAGAQHAVLAQAGHGVVARAAGRQVDEDHVRLRRRVQHTTEPAQAFGQPLRIRVILDEPIDVMVKRVQRRGGQHAGLAQTAAEHLAHAMRARDQLAAANQRRAHPRAEAFAEAHRHAVEQLRHLARLGACVAAARMLLRQCDRRVEQACAVQMRGQAMAARQRSGFAQVVDAEHLAAERVLQAQQARAREM